MNYRLKRMLTNLRIIFEMLTRPEHLISPLVFIAVHVFLSFVSPYFMLLSCLLNFEF